MGSSKSSVASICTLIGSAVSLTVSAFTGVGSAGFSKISAFSLMGSGCFWTGAGCSFTISTVFSAGSDVLTMDSTFSSKVSSGVMYALVLMNFLFRELKDVAFKISIISSLSSSSRSVTSSLSRSMVFSFFMVVISSFSRI